MSMNSEPYIPNNSRMAMFIITLLCVCGLLAAWLIGPSEKPQVDAIAISTQPLDSSSPTTDCVGSDDESCVEADIANAVSVSQTEQASESKDPSDELVADSESGETAEVTSKLGASLASAVTGAAVAATPQSQVAAQSDTIQTQKDTNSSLAAAEASGGADVNAKAIATVEPLPTPTPELAPAVTPESETSESEPVATAGDTAILPAMVAGQATGRFFTKNEEANGAVTGENTLVVTFEQDGSGSFRGILELDYKNDTSVRLDMSGAIEWTANNPQVDNVLAGTYKRTYTDGRVDVSDEATLKITHLESGSGSLCTTECFGITFSKD